MAAVGGRSGPVQREEPARPSLRELFTIERPPPATPATRRLRALIALTAAATVVVEILNLGTVAEPGFGLAVRTVWALLRGLGFLFLMRAVRYGRLGSRPFGLILAVTTVFAVSRLLIPRAGRLLPPLPVLVGFAVIFVLCGGVVWLLYRSRAIDRHLTRRPPRRHIPPWALSTRVAALSYAALLSVPCLVAAGTLAGGHRLVFPVALALVAAWLVLAVAVGWLVPWVSLFAVYGRRWARWVLGLVTALVLVVQPVLCWLLLGPDGVLRDGAPLVVTATLALVGLWRTRGRPTSPRQ
jgi:hypothetical protein